MELTIRAIFLAIILTIMLAMSNAYLALKLGILTSASIPAAIISMGILRFFKNSTKLENNIVQTAASAGEAVAGGIVYTVPALIIIQYWHKFNYWENVCIALLGGILGVLLSIPLRKILMRDPLLKFPEAHAIAAILNIKENKFHSKYILWGGFVGSIFEFIATGLQWIADSWHYWSSSSSGILYGWSFGFSQTMLGAGFLIGTEMALSIGLGAIFSWGIFLPLVSFYFPNHTPGLSAEAMVFSLWNIKLRYIGIGAMLFAGLWTFIKLMKPLLSSVIHSLNTKLELATDTRKEQDIPLIYLFFMGFLVSVSIGIFCLQLSPLQYLSFIGKFDNKILAIFIVSFILVVGGLLVAMTAYFSGMAGVSASPGSAIIISGVLLTAVAIRAFIGMFLNMQTEDLFTLEALVIVVGSIIAGMVAVACDNIQDLKIGHLVGATPWKQQLMLLLGVIISALVIPPVMQVLFDVYGIAGVMPRSGMDVSQSLPAPTAALIAGVVQSVFQHNIPWLMFLLGAFAILIIIIAQGKYLKNLSILGIAMGMYLPLSLSMPLCFGGILAYIYSKDLSFVNRKKYIALIACGIVTGSALMDILLSIPFSITGDPNLLKLGSVNLEPYRLLFSVLSFIGLNILIYRRSGY